MDRLIWLVFGATRGGPTRARIVQAILVKPANANQLAKDLVLDYKTVEYNLRVLVKHRLIVCEQPRTYGALYSPSKNLLASRQDFEAVSARLPTDVRPGGDLGKATSGQATGGVPR